MDWGNSWWEDSYNAALGSGSKKKKKKNSLQKMKKAGDSDNSDSDTNGSTSGSGSDDSDDEEDKTAPEPEITSQKAHLFAIGAQPVLFSLPRLEIPPTDRTNMILGLAAHPEASKKQGAGFIKGGTVMGDELVEEEGAVGLGFSDEKPKKKRKYRTDETDKATLERVGGRRAVGGREQGGGTGKMKRKEKQDAEDAMIVQQLIEKKRKAAEEAAAKKSGKKPRRSPRIQALQAPGEPETGKKSRNKEVKADKEDTVVWGSVAKKEFKGLKVKKKEDGLSKMEKARFKALKAAKAAAE